MSTEDAADIVSVEVRAGDGADLTLPGGARLSLPAGALSADSIVTLTSRSPADTPADWVGMRVIGPGIEVDLGGAELVGTAIVALPVDLGRLPPGTPPELAIAARYGAAGWVPVGGRYDVQREAILVTVDTFSEYWVFGPDLDALAARVNEAIDAVAEGLGLSVAQPRCDPMAGEFELHGSVLGAESLFRACLQAPGSHGDVVLKLSNNRAYSILVDVPSGRGLVESTAGGQMHDELLQVARRLVGTEGAYLPAGGIAQIALEVPPGQEILLEATAAWSSLLLDFAIAIMTSIAPADVRSAKSVIECSYRAVSEGSSVAAGNHVLLRALAAIVKDCVSAAAEALGTAGFARYWGPIEDSVRLGRAGHEYVDDLDVFRSGGGRVTIANLTPASSPEPSSTPSPTSVGVDVLRFDGLGPLVVGMSLEEANRTAGSVFESGDEEIFGPYCFTGNWAGFPDGLSFLFLGDQTEQVLARVGVYDGSVVTEGGLGIGSRETDVLSAYAGRVDVSPHPYVADGHYLFIPSDAADDLALLFETDGTMVTSFRAGDEAAVMLIEGCA